MVALGLKMFLQSELYRKSDKDFCGNAHGLIDEPSLSQLG